VLDYPSPEKRPSFLRYRPARLARHLPFAPSSPAHDLLPCPGKSSGEIGYYVTSVGCAKPLHSDMLPHRDEFILLENI
jgi:hypothetical protein